MPNDYIERAAEAGLDTIGFSNHFWDSDVPGVNGWYTGLDLDYLMTIKDEITPKNGVKTLIGCECEFPGRLALTKEHAKEFDYVCITTSHYHQDVVFADIPLRDFTEVRELMIERFLLGVAAGAELDVPVSMSHPFRPLGHFGEQDDALASISDRVFLELFDFAAQKNVSIEIHLGTMTHNANDDVINPNSERMIQLAKKAGCTFTFGTDEHNFRTFAERNHSLQKIVKNLGITPEMMMILEK